MEMCGDIFDTMNGEGAAAFRAEGPRMLRTLRCRCQSHAQGAVQISRAPW